MATKRIRWILVVLASVAVLALATGCGAPGNKAGGSGAVGAVGAATQGAVVFSTDVYAPEDFAKLATGFSKAYPKIKLTYEQFPGDSQQRRDKIKTMFAAGNAPDVIEFDYMTPWLPMYQTLFTPMDGMIAANKDFKLESLAPGSVDYLKKYTSSDKILSLPGQLSPCGILYNKTLFDTFKVPYPTDDMTWDQVAELARKITRTEGGKKYYGLWLSNWDSAAFAGLLYPGAGVLETDYSKKKIFEDEATIRKVLEVAVKIQTDPKVTVPYAEFVGGKMPFDQFNSGNVGMWPEQLWTVTNLRMLDKKTPVGFKWGVARFPRFGWDSQGLAPQPGAQPVVINAASKDKASAFAFIKWYFGNDFQVERSKTLGLLPSIVTPDALAAFKAGESGLENWDNVVKQPFKTLIPNTDAKTSGYDEQYNSIRVETYDKLLLGKTGIDGAVKGLKAAAQKILDSMSK